MLSGLGFFIAGKLVAFSVMENITPVGQALLTAEGFAAGLSLQMASALIIQMACTGIAGYGLSKTNGRWRAKSIGFFATTVLIHLAYYVFIITVVR